ncbi:hypothetical protein FLL45_17015 [Aliikangiella marina]|uniref:STAS/SEC14 domain-containing protein n=1 Tax=Aliikangiella marina TaxID=1712262 RepID=A0A545T7I6_9GAMM|nr:STAS/SEC14 domain-containing protein [Aliikangiella marina]TQV73152.1 hypothetical protein FLL45_17015 [Aliikangiella marina]
MSLQITHDPEKGYIEASYQGKLTYGAALAMLSAIENLMTSNPNIHRLYDLDKATLAWSLEDIDEIIKLIDSKSHANLDESKVALVHSSESDIAIIELFIHQANLRFNRIVRHFRSIEEARHWITTTV